VFGVQALRPPSPPSSALVKPAAYADDSSGDEMGPQSVHIALDLGGQVTVTLA
jgi:hypothetical protein